MLFVRGINGKLKLNPAVKVWGSILLLVTLIVGGLAYRLLEFRETLAECSEQGGIWVGGPLPSAFCSLDHESETNW
jgi:hypothetical protein